MATKFDFSDFETTGATGMDAFLRKETVPASKATRRMVASLGDLSDFVRVSGETLVHKSKRDLWALKKEGESFFIERLFDDNGEPLKG